MADVQHTIGSDLTTSASGDIAVSQGTQLGQERVLRRLLTNPTNYIWQLPYGAGLGSFVGLPINPERIEAVVRAQMYREAIVARTPAPVVTVVSSDASTVVLNIQYVDATSQTPQTLTFTVNG